MDAPELLWSPPADVRQRSRVGHYLAWLERERSLRFADYDALWRWSVEDLEGFWSSIWEHFELITHAPYERVLAHRAMPGARWFPGARLNYAEHALRGDPGALAVIARSQSRGPIELTVGELRHQVARARAGLQALGVGEGDRVAAYLPNQPEAMIAFLATASLGALWASCAPEFGTRAVVDRLAQIEPKVLLAVDGYRYGAKAIDRREEVARIRAALPSLGAGEGGRVVSVAYLDGHLEDALPWDDLLARAEPLEFAPLPFGHPLYVLFSSGTTGLPKPILHGHGGILVEHTKTIALHHDLGPGDRFFWFSTTGWMMWNYVVSAPLAGAAAVLFDGNPGDPDLMELWRLAHETGTTFFGTSAPFLLSCRKAGLHPGRDADLARLRGVGSTGAPLPPEGFHWVYDEVSPAVLLASASGGTDVCTAFVTGSPLVPVYAGEISCRALGAAVQAFDPAGRSVVGELGELVITEPMPSMPVGFWNDPDGSRYRAAYFEDFPGVWRHGDWIRFTERGTCTITGRSDATLNRGGVRLGTSEFYSAVEGLPEVADSLVVHLEDAAGGAGELLLFVVPADGVALDDALRARIARELRTQLSPRHVPDAILGVPAVPRTLSGKKLEVPVKRILRGAPAERAAAQGALADPGALAWFEALARERGAREADAG